MSVNLRFPSITAGTEKEQLAQIKSYLHQLVEQLNYALSSTSEGSAQTYEVQGGEMSYYELRSLIIQQLQETKIMLDQLAKKFEDEYIKDEELPKLIEDALAVAKASGEFDGPPGPKGDPGISPTVTVQKIGGGHKVTITDATSTKTFAVMDGEIGARFKLDDGTFLY